MHPVAIAALVSLTIQAVNITAAWIMAKKIARDVVNRQVENYRSSSRHIRGYRNCNG